MEYKKIKIEPLDANFGAVVSGLDLSAGKFRPDTVAEIKNAYAQYQLLLFKDKILGPESQIAFSKIFGELERFPYHSSQLKAHPEIFRLSTDENKGYANVGFYWHQDGSFRPTPTATSIFHLVEVPQEGGETLFANAYAAYDRIPDDLKPLAEKMKTVHTGNIVHDLVINHPLTGKKALYLNMGLVRSITGFGPHEKEDAQALMGQFQPILDHPDVMYTHKWREGDLLVADNYAVFHKATAAEPGHQRTMHRTSILGGLALNR